MNRQSKQVYKFGPFVLDAAEQLLLRDGRPVHLKPKAFDLLVFFVENSGALLDKDLLLKQVWANTFVEETNLTLNVSELRKALSDEGKERRFIETVPRRGYRFRAVVVRSSPGETTEGPVVQPEAVRTSNSRPGGRVRSIAVLPFRQLGGNSGDDNLGLGMADALITRLSNLRQITVRPTSAVRRYANEKVDPVAAGRELKVQSVLDGNIRMIGEQVRVTVQLVKVKDGAPLWGDSFDEPSTNIFAVEDSISEQVAKALTVRTSAEERKCLAKRYTGNAEAYRAYLKGRSLWNKRTPDAVKKGIKYFEEAIEADPDYALAYTGLADCYTHLGSYRILPPRESFVRAKQAAMTALELDDALAEAHASLGFLLIMEWEWTSCEREFKRALGLNPNSATAHKFYALYLRLQGRFDEALAEIRQAQEINPVSLAIDTAVAGTLYLARQYDRALEKLLRVVELDPDSPSAHFHLGAIYEARGMYHEAIAAYEKKLRSNEDPETLAFLARAYALSDRRSEALLVLDRLEGASKRREIVSCCYHLALVYVALGETEQAFAWLEKAYEERDESLALLKVEPKVDPLRKDPRFEDLLCRVGLSQAPLQ